MKGTSTVESTPLGSKRTISSESERPDDWPEAGSKKKCEVRKSVLPGTVTPRERFSQRMVPFSSVNGSVWPGVGVVVYASTTSEHAPPAAIQVAAGNCGRSLKSKRVFCWNGNPLVPDVTVVTLYTMMFGSAYRNTSAPSEPTFRST